MTIKPTRLKKGCQIGVVSPSTPVTPGDEQLRRGVALLEGMGFTVQLGKHVFSNTLGYSASPLEKAEDINTMFADESIQAIICSQGGQTANTALPFLDWGIIRDNSKIFLGMSDITVLLNAIFLKTGLITFHGHDLVWGLGRVPTSYDLGEFEGRLIQARIGTVAANGERRTVRGGTGEGLLLGGNLGCLLKLAGTPYFPDARGAILFLEGTGLNPETCDFMFSQLQQMGVFNQVQGVIIGYIDGLDNHPEITIKMEDILLNVTKGNAFPILKVNDFGHNCANTILPVGMRARLDADEPSIEILESCLE
jgi:muramoyltetrapeptide carboxypeptidase